jgi:hypothetical protein
LKKLRRWLKPEEFNPLLGISKHAVARRFGSLYKFYSIIEKRADVDSIIRAGKKRYRSDYSRNIFKP